MTEQHERTTAVTRPDECRLDYRPSWRCRGCGVISDDYPGECLECGHESFQAIER